MGYACPVCETPHQDATHLANHLAFTAMTHAADHETWLDDNVPGWRDRGEADLAATVAEIAPEAEYDRVFEDTVRDRGTHRNGSTHNHGTTPDGAPAGVDPETAATTGRGSPDGDTRAVLDEARELTAAMLDDEGEPSDPNEEDPDGDGVDD